MDPDELDRLLDELYGEGEPSPPDTADGESDKPPQIPTQPPGVPDWLWQRYLAANREYDEVWEDLKNSGGGVDDFGLPKGVDPALQTRANNARSLLTGIITQIDNYMPKQTAAVDPEDAALKRRLLAAQVASAEGGPMGPQRTPQTAAELEYDQLRNQELRMKMAGERTPWERAQEEYKRQREEEQDKYKREQDEISRHQQQQSQEMARRNYAWQAANDLMQRRLQAAPMALIPGQQYFLGTEPGGVMQDIYKRSNLKYDPERFRVPVIDYDPEEAWRRAMGMFGR